MIRISSFCLLLVAVVYSQNANKLCEEIQNKAGIYLARLPSNCSMYDVCVNKKHLATMICGGELVFSNAYSTCVYKDGPYDDCKVTTITGGFYNDDLCKPNPNGLNIDPNDCSRYIPCFNMTSSPSMPCQTSLYFSFKEQRCMQQEDVDCQVKS